MVVIELCALGKLRSASNELHPAFLLNNAIRLLTVLAADQRAGKRIVQAGVLPFLTATLRHLCSIETTVTSGTPYWASGPLAT